MNVTFDLCRLRSSDGNEPRVLLKLLIGMALIMSGKGLYLVTIEGFIESFFLKNILL